MTFGEKLYALRRAAGYSQEDLAEKLEVTRQAVSRWEGGAVLPDAPNLLQLGRLFDVSIDYLLKDELTELHPAPPEAASRAGEAAPPPAAEAALPAGDGVASFPRKTAAPRRALRLWVLAFQVLGFVLVLHDLWEQDERFAFLWFVLFNLLSVLVFEVANQLLPGTPEARSRSRLRFYRMAVWLLIPFPLTQIIDALWMLVPFPYPWFAPELVKLALYLFLCAGITYAARESAP